MVTADVRSRLFRSRSQWIAAGICAVLGLVVYLWVDLTPEIRDDFFFASDDPQLQSSRQIEREFGSAPQVFVAARSTKIASREYLGRISRLTEALSGVDGVVGVQSITHGPRTTEKVLRDEPAEVFEDLDTRPFWRRLLLAPDGKAMFIVLQTDGRGVEQQAAVINAIDRILDEHRKQDFQLDASGVPYVSEHIRQRLIRDLRTFSIAAFVMFAVIVGLLFRSVAILVGTMVAALAACFGTFAARALLGMPGDILMPNLWTIAFVLTLSHVVYLAAEWQRRLAHDGPEDAVRKAVRLTGPASAWSLAANLLGFASLIFVSAQPLRQFGISGIVAAVLAMICAFALFPPFLRSATPRPINLGPIAKRLQAFFTAPHRVVAATAIVAALALAPFAFRVQTDPTLPSYFAEDDPIRSGLDAIDKSGGSSPLDLVIRDARNQRFDDGDMVNRLQALEARLERHPDVGAVLSLASLMGEAERPWYAFLFSWKKRLEQLDSPKAGRIGQAFVSDDRKSGRFILRMHESARSRPREEVVNEIAGIVRAQGFRPVRIGGLYQLQGELSELVEGSVVRGLGGLLVTFFVIVLVVTRVIPVALAMMAGLAMTPLALFGAVGLFKMPVDIISAPAANVALPLGVDEMIHMGYAIRRSKQGNTWPAWREALTELWRPILFSMIVVASGFALFLLSSFPPTQRLGLLVCAGAIITDLVVLVVVPAIAARRRTLDRGVQPR